MFGFGVQELILILAIILLLFGGKKLPELSRNLGSAVKDLRKGFTDDTSDKKEDTRTES